MDARLEAYRLLLKVFIKNLYSNKLLDEEKKYRELSNQDHDLLYNLVKGVIKMKKNLDFIAGSYASGQKYEETPQKIKILLYLALYQLIYCDAIPDYAVVNESVGMANKLYGEKVGGFINAVLRTYLRQKSVTYPADPVEKLASVYSFPSELIDIWMEYWGYYDTEKICQYFNQVPLLNLRINRFATDCERLIQYFSRRGIKLDHSPISENILVTDQARQVLSDVAFSEGYFSVQDASAALVTELLKPAENETVLDLFAGPGGKATYCAEMMRNTGEIIAVDKFPGKTKKVKQAASRLQLTNINIITEDAFNYGPVAPAYDKVILDVPCSGWGVFQKKAELRWQSHQDMPKLLKLQDQALKQGAQFVKPGGILLYSTCTLNRDENEEQVQNFLNRNKNFRLEPAGRYISSEYTSGNYLLTLPFRHQTDGAFAARLQRIK
ncbi:MAG: 16S rRNA (cytosine(967)-C(5))-methyltransferase RsmB [Candidatus Cloacimonetes bacterium]|nr:16S rRNA (cytosine(967)-C(5))-methyltransferase RsmB [Candidatus Cloacimonadota bacterium]